MSDSTTETTTAPLDVGDGRFDWMHDPSVILREQPATAVYWNDFGQAVIRQEEPWPEDEDIFVVINRAHLEDVINALETLLTGGVA